MPLPPPSRAARHSHRAAPAEELGGDASSGTAVTAWSVPLNHNPLPAAPPQAAPPSAVGAFCWNHWNQFQLLIRLCQICSVHHLEEAVPRGDTVRGKPHSSGKWQVKGEVRLGVHKKNTKGGKPVLTVFLLGELWIYVTSTWQQPSEKGTRTSSLPTKGSLVWLQKLGSGHGKNLPRNYPLGTEYQQLKILCLVSLTLCWQNSGSISPVN